MIGRGGEAARGGANVAAQMGAREDAAREERRARGVVYTPEALGRRLAEGSLGEALRALRGRHLRDGAGAEGLRAHRAALRGLRVLDPACGHGALLLAALELLAAEHARVERALAALGIEAAPATLDGNLFGLDVDPAAIEAARAALRARGEARGRALGDLSRALRVGDAVVDDAAIDPRAFDWGAWPHRFDVVIGNPPYVRQARLGPFKAHFEREFRAFHGNADLFVYFFERALERLAPGGWLAFVVSNKWLRGAYAAPLRALLAREATLISLTDLGHAPLFDGADAFPCVVTLRKGAPGPAHEVRIEQPALASGAPRRCALPQAALDARPWSLEPPAVARLLAKLRAGHPTLVEHAGGKPYRGVLTGLNEAFVIDEATRARLCAEDPRSAELCERLLRGQDLGRWSPTWGGRWLIFARRGVELARYPAIARHLAGFRARLEPRPDAHRGGWAGRKAGAYAWFEIQDTVDYFARFEAPKLVYQVIQFRPAYAIDREGFFLNDKGFLIPGDDPWLLATLNSPLMWWHNWRTLVHLKDEALTPVGEKVSALPIATPSAAQRARVARDVAAIEARTRDARDVEGALAAALAKDHGVTSLARALRARATLDEDALLSALGPGARSAAQVAALRALVAAHLPALRAAREAIRALEAALAREVHAAYRLDEADEALLWETAPPRMPDVGGSAVRT